MYVYKVKLRKYTLIDGRKVEAGEIVSSLAHTHTQTQTHKLVARK